MLLSAAAVLLSAKCNKDGAAPATAKIDTVATPSGLKYVIWKKGTGEQPADGDKVQVHYAGRLLSNGEEFDNSYKRSNPFEFTLGKGMVIKGWDEGIGKLHVGDSATLVIPHALGYGEHGRPGIPGKSTLVFDVKLMGVKKTVKPVPFATAGLDTLSTPSGLRYIMVHRTEGPQARSGANVKVHYTGYLKDGKVFDSSVQRGEPIGFPLGQGRVIKGWDEGIQLLKVGEKARLLIPSKLAYGEQGAGGIIAPNTDLIFDVELVSIN
jgi:peptidylprolyl isomerase